jgi:hypothetical protein
LQPSSPVIDVLSDGDVDEVHSVVESQSVGFTDVTIVTPPIAPKNILKDVVALNDGDVDEVHSVGFMDVTIVTPPMAPKSIPKDEIVLNAVKRNLNQAFDGVAKVDARKSLRRVKIEKE